MTLKTKFYVAAATVAFILLVTLITSLWSDRKIAKLEREVEDAKIVAEKNEAAARRFELEAAEYKRKIEYLEESLSALKLSAEKQDEDIKSLEADTDTARRNVRRARDVRTRQSSIAELCAKLAALGHPCER